MLVFLFLAGILATYAFWVYLRVELTVPAARSLAVVRASILSLVLLLLFDPRLPFEATGAAPTPWVLLDASMSMTVEGLEGSSPAEVAAERAAEDQRLREVRQREAEQARLEQERFEDEERR